MQLVEKVSQKHKGHFSYRKLPEGDLFDGKENRHNSWCIFEVILNLINMTPIVLT